MFHEIIIPQKSIFVKNFNLIIFYYKKAPQCFHCGGGKYVNLKFALQKIKEQDANDKHC